MSNCCIHFKMSPMFAFPPFSIIGKFLLLDQLSWAMQGSGFCCEMEFLCCGGRVGKKRHEQMLLFISILSCVRIWLQVAKSIFNFCRQHHRQPVYFFWAPPHLLPMSWAVANAPRYQEGKQTVSLQSWSSESGKNCGVSESMTST